MRDQGIMTRIITWNVNGLNSPNKRKVINLWLKKQKAEIIFYKKCI